MTARVREVGTLTQRAVANPHTPYHTCAPHARYPAIARPAHRPQTSCPPPPPSTNTHVQHVATACSPDAPLSSSAVKAGSVVRGRVADTLGRPKRSPALKP